MALDRIRVDWSRNTRARDDDAIETYSHSIRRVGVVVPVVLALLDNDPDFDAELVAGFHRYEAARVAECADIPYVVRDQETRQEAHAVENIARAGLWPLEEAVAIESLLAKGYTQQGAAEVLSKSPQWIAAREPLLALPEQLRAPWGPQSARGVLGGHPPLSVAKRLRDLNAVAPWAAERLVELALMPEPTDDWPAPQNALMSLYNEGQRGGDGRTARDVICHKAPKGAFVAPVSGPNSSLRGDDVLAASQIKRAKDLAQRLDTVRDAWEKVNDSYSYFRGVRFNEQDIDTLRALGVLFVLSGENDDHWFSAICFERDPWLEAVEAAIVRVEEDIAARKQARASQSTAGKKAEDLTPEQQAQRALRATQRDMASPVSAGRAANHELFAALYGGESIVQDGVQIDVARLFVEQWLGGRDLKFTDEGKLNASSNYMAGNITERIHLVSRVKLAVPELSRVETPQRKDGKPGKAKVVYATDQETWAWILRYLDGAKTSVELFDRAIKLMIIGQQTIAHAYSAGRSTQPFPIGLSCKEAEKPLAVLTKGRVPKAIATVKGALTRAYKAAGSGLDSRI
jgi:ParB/RepB/Spo0J family partition protein